MQRLPTARRQLNDAGAGVDGVGDSSDIAVPFQGGHPLGYRLPAHPELVGQIRCVQSAGRQGDQRNRLCRANPVESGRGERRSQMRRPRRGDQVHQRRHGGLPIGIRNASHGHECATRSEIDKLLVKHPPGCHDGFMRSRCFRVLAACLLPVLVVALGGCLGDGHALGTPGSQSIPVGQSTQTIESGGVSRTFHLYRPQGLSDAVPLVVMLHGGFGTGTQAERSYRWDAEADNGRFLVAYPDGLNRAWNAGTCCGASHLADVDDVGFIASMVGAIEQQIPIDRARVYVTGMSNGAMMALRLGCQTDTFAAIAPVAGTLLTDCSQARPTSVLQIHGTADERVPYNGGPGKALGANGLPRVDGPSVESVDATWRSIDGCGAPTSSTAGNLTTQTAGCADGRTVELISVAGAGHQWPDGELDATGAIWQFFAPSHR
jgi:polyhydroxybutyrate depolymerase